MNTNSYAFTSVMTSPQVSVILEVEMYSNHKWEYDKENNCLFLDRILKYPYFYPFAYGFIPKTLGNDGDELDILLITNEHYLNYNDLRATVEGYIVGGLMMYDEKGADEKIFVVPADEIENYKNKPESELQTINENIRWFFSNYKSQEEGEGKWSRVERFLNVDEAIKIYEDSVSGYMAQIC